MIPSGSNEDEPPLRKLTTSVDRLSFGHTSSNGNDYVRLYADGEMFFVWNDSWQEELEENEHLYTAGTTFEILFRDKSDDPNDSFLCLEAIVPENPDKAGMFLEMSMPDDFEGTTEEEKESAKEAMKEIFEAGKA